MISPRKQFGLTLIEVLIALSIFSMIGIASYRVLSTVAYAQHIGEEHSIQLSRIQKAMAMIDTDLQQLVSRGVRVSKTAVAGALQVNSDSYAIELTRGGWSNPLMLSRSSLQRVAYDIGLHPDVNNDDSSYYQDDTTYLRRHYWRVLDRTGQSPRITQALLPNVESLTVNVVSDLGRHTTWPLTSSSGKSAMLKGIELRFEHKTLGEMSRLYKVH